MLWSIASHREVAISRAGTRVRPRIRTPIRQADPILRQAVMLSHYQAGLGLPASSLGLPRAITRCRLAVVGGLLGRRGRHPGASALWVVVG